MSQPPPFLHALFTTFLTVTLTTCSGNDGPKAPLIPDPIPPPNDASPTTTADPAPPPAAFDLLLMRDTQTGSLWNLRGEAIEGELVGARLQQVPAYSAYWFAWASFWPNTAVYRQDGSGQLRPEAFAELPFEEFVPDVPPNAIPPLDVPPAGFGQAQFVPASLATYLMPEDIVVGVHINGDARAYPAKILNFHEIVNHNVGGRQVAVTYCPLTASGIHFAADAIAFGNTGGLYNNNMVMYDRDSESLWSQMRLSAIIGARAGQRLDLLPIFQGTWRAWQTLYPKTLVLTEETGYIRNYRREIYIESSYTVSFDIWFPQTPPIDTRYHPKEMVLGLIGQQATLAYPFADLPPRAVINDAFEDQKIVVAHQQDAHLALAFNRQVDGRTLSFELVE